MNKKSIAFLGSGNMAEAIIKGVIFSDIFDSRNVVCSDKSTERLQYVKRKYKVLTTSDNKEAANSSDVLVISVKPQNINELLNEIKEINLSRKIVVSICAGVKCTKLEQSFKDKVAVIRVMPNTPALVGSGVSAIAKGNYALKKDLGVAKKIFEGVGEVFEIEEELMDTVTAISGSGPAYVFYLLEAMIEAGEKLKLKDEYAKKLALHTFMGAAKLALDSKDDLKTLRKKVTSKGGTTEKAINLFAEKKLKDIFIAGIKAAAQRSKELSQG